MSDSFAISDQIQTRRQCSWILKLQPGQSSYQFISWCHKNLSKKIFGYVEDVDRFDDKRVCEHDVLFFLFVRLDKCAVERKKKLNR